MKTHRKGLRLIALAISIAVLFGLAAPAMAATNYYATVKNNNTPVYSSTAKTTTLGVFNTGDVVSIKSQVTNLNLYVVYLSGNTTNTGYIDKSAVSGVVTSLKSGTSIATVKSGTTTGGSVGVIDVTSCIMRASASTTSAKLATLNKGTAVSLLGSQDDFYKVVANGITGYVLKIYVKITNSSGTGSTATGTPGVIANCSSYVNFRATASASGTLLGTLSKGTAVSVLATEGSFYKIVANGKTGYVSKQYVTLTSTGGTTTPTTPTTSTPVTGVVTSNNTYVALRSSTGSSFSTVTKVKTGTTVTITAESGNFYKVTVSGKTGYLLKTNVKTSSSTGGTATTTTGVISNVSSYANMRATASASGTLITKVNKGTTVTVLGTEGEFYKVSYNGKTGYISNKYVTISSGTGGGTTTGGTGTDTGAVTLGTGGIKVEPYKSTTPSTIASKLNAAKKTNSKTIGYISISGTNIQQPILYYGSSNVHYYASRDINNRSSSAGAIYAFYGQMVRNNTITGHNMRGSNGMFHQLHHIQEKTLGLAKCQTTDNVCKGSFSSAPSLTVAANRTWDISLFGYNRWEVWAMYETPANESSNTLKYNINPLSSYKPAQIKSWIEYQKSRSEYKFNTAVSTDDIFLTVYTCGNNYDYAAAQSRIYYFLKAVK